MIIPLCEKTVLEIYYCQACRSYYRRGFEKIGSCLVDHGSGSCCHLGDDKLDAEKYETNLAEIAKMINRMIKKK